MKLGMDISLRDLLQSAGAGSTLLNDLVSYWNFDTDWTDAVGDNDLTPSASPPTRVNAGPSGTVAKFVNAAAESLSRASTSFTATTTTPWTMVFWVKPGSLPSVSMVAHHADGTTPLFIGAWSGQYRVYVGATQLNLADSSAGQWEMLAVWYDGANLKRSLNAGTPVSTAVAAHGLNGSATFSVGTRTDAGGFSWEGDMGPVGVWNADKSAELTSLFNSGNGKRYADLTTAEKVGLVSYWNLDEVSGNRADSHGTNTLTDNATVLGYPDRYVAFSNANQSLTKTGIDIDLSTTGFTAAGWFYVSDGFPTMGLDTGSGRIFLVQNSQYYVFKDNSTWETVGLSIPYPGWQHISVWWDPADKKGYGSVNGGTAVSTTALSNLNYAVSTWTLGGVTTGNTFGVGLWNRVLSSGERTALAASFNRHRDLSDAQKIGLVSWWDLGNTLDSVGSNHLTVTNALTFNPPAAMSGAAASFVAASSESLSRSAQVTAWPAATTISAWVKVPNLLDDYHVILMEAQSNYQYNVSWQLYVDPNGLGTFGFFVADTSEWRGTAAVSSVGSAGVWTHLVAWLDPSVGTYGTAYISKNGGTPESATLTGATTASDPSWLLFARNNASTYNTMAIDEVAIWSRVLTADERAELWAAGAGKFYDFSE